MAHTIIKGDVIANMFLGILAREVVLPRLMNSHSIADFIGDQNDTKTVKIQTKLTARAGEFRDRTTPMVTDELNQARVDIKLTQRPYSAVAITDEVRDLDITDFAAEVVQPQARAMAEFMEDALVATMAGANLPAEHDLNTPTLGTDDPVFLLTRGNTLLTKQHVPLSNRVYVMGADVMEAYLERYSDVSVVGTSSALEQASMPPVRGVRLVQSLALPSNVAYLYHRDAFSYVSAAPSVPQSVTTGASIARERLAIRWHMDYDTNNAEDRAVAMSYFGSGVTNEGGTKTDNRYDTCLRAVKFTWQ